jgi:hypothetical protein
LLLDDDHALVTFYHHAVQVILTLMEHENKPSEPTIKQMQFREGNAGLKPSERRPGTGSEGRSYGAKKKRGRRLSKKG